MQASVKNPEKKTYVLAMLTGFGAISLSVLFFFLLYRLQGVEEALANVTDILMPFIYGGVIAYLLRPMCNAYSSWLSQLFKGKRDSLAETLAITGSMITGALVVYTLIIMIAPSFIKVPPISGKQCLPRQRLWWNGQRKNSAKTKCCFAILT